MTTEQRAALEPLRKQFDYLERPLFARKAAGPQRVDCYRESRATELLEHCGLAVIHTNGFVDWWRAR